MVAMRVSFFFEQGPYGWSESVHNLGASYTQVAIPAFALRDARLALLPGSAKLTYLRISDDEAPRDSVLLNEFAANVGLSPVPNSDPTFTSNLIRISASSRVRRALYMRPAFLGEGSNGDRVVNDPQWLNRYPAWRNQLLDAANGWAVRFWADSDTGLNVQGVDNSTGNLVINIPGAGLAVDTSFKLRNFSANVRLNGQYRITAKTGDLYTVTPNKLAGQTILVYAMGKAFTTSRAMLPVTGCTFVRTTSRKTGRPFASPRGRRGRVR